MTVGWRPNVHISSLAKGEEIALRDAGVDACYLKGLTVPELAERLFETSGKLNAGHASNGAGEGSPAHRNPNLRRVWTSRKRGS